MVSEVNDPDLIRQLEAGGVSPATPTSAPAGAPVSDATAAMLDQLSGQTPMTIRGAMAKWGMPGLDPTSPSYGTMTSPQQLSLVRGGRDFLDTWAQRLGRGVEAAAPYSLWNQIAPVAEMATAQRQKIEEAIRQAEADYRMNWRPDIPAGGSDPFRTAGNMAANAVAGSLIPGGASASLFPRMASGAVSGGLYAGQPNNNADVSGGDYWSGQGKDAGINAAIGGAAPAVLSALARIVRPNTNPEVQTLMENGVRPTPGQIMGGSANRVEQAMTSVPVLGDFVKSGRARAGEQFDRGAINQVLAPIGEKLEAPSVGRDAIVEMGDKVRAAYDAAVPNAAMALPSTASQDIAVLKQMASFMPQSRATQFNNILQETVLNKISPNGHMTGESFKEAESDLGKRAADYLHNHAATSDERQLGGAIRELQSTLRGWLQQANPASAAEIGKANSAYAQMLRVENAVTRSGGDPGLFSPAQLQAAAKKFSTTRAYARGEGLMQPYADAGRSVLGATLPDSGTPFRSLATIGAGAALGHGISPTAAMGGLAAGGALAGIYNPVSQAAIAHLLTTRPEAAQGLADTLRGLAPSAGGAAPGLWGSLAPLLK